MKIQIERGAAYRVQGYSAHSVVVTRGEADALHTLTGPSLLRPDGPPGPWGNASAAPAVTAFESLLEFEPELVLYGSGARLRFPEPAVLQLFHGRGIGFETMDTFAACRTYNVLCMEGRRVLAALLIGDTGA
jgi:uncharacterized protein